MLRPHAEDLPPGTDQDAALRQRILLATTRLVASRGVAGTSIERILALSKASRTQFYRHFASKDAVIEAVVELQVDVVLSTQRVVLAQVESVTGLRDWAETTLTTTRAAGGCPLGVLVRQLAEQPDARGKVENAFRTWESYLAGALRRVQTRGELDAVAKPDELATGIIAALQGGLLLARARRSEQPVRTALDLAIDRLTSAAERPGQN